MRDSRTARGYENDGQGAQMLTFEVTTANNRALADEFSKLEQEFKALLAQLDGATDPLERRLLLADTRTLLHLANDLFKQHDESLRKRLRKSSSPQPQSAVAD